MLSTSNGSLARAYARGVLNVCAALAVAIPLAVNAATPQLVRNINDAVIPNSSYPHELGALNGKFLFAAGSNSEGLWSTDGTAAGTVLIKKFGPPPGVVVSSGVPSFVQLGARGYFVAEDGVTGPELWSTDGSAAGTTLVVDLRPGPTGGFIDFRGTFDNRLIFATSDGGNFQMYITDGTAAGTHVLTTFSGANAGLDTATFIADDKFYFVAHDNNFQRQIWASDGTFAGTHALPIPGSAATFSNPSFFQRLGNRALFVAEGGFWTIDLATDAIDRVFSSPGVGSAPIAELISFGAFLMYIADGAAFGSLALWRTNGTEAGSSMVGNIHPGPAPFAARQAPVFRKVGDKVVYIADDGTHGPQLWSSDGSPANTVRLTNATMPANVSHQIAIPVGTFGDTGYFMMPDGASTTTWSMWRTDGTVAGTRRIAGLPSVDQSTAAGSRMTGDSTNVFITLFNAPTNSLEPQSSLWKYEPALDRLTSLRPSLRYFAGDLWFYDGQRLYFADNDRVIGNEPWVSDGTAAGTHLILDISSQGTADNGSAPNEFVEFGGRVVFAADNGVSGRELWISDGTAAGTTQLADINPGIESSNPNRLAVANGALYFFASDGSGISHFMRLSSPTAQVEALLTASPGPGAPQPCERDVPVAFGGNVYFAAQTDGNPPQLWKSDGTVAGTSRALTSTAAGTYPCELTVSMGRLFFSSADGELWTTDGTSRATFAVTSLPDGSRLTGSLTDHGQLYFTVQDDHFKAQLWATQGTPAGTSQASNFNSTPFVRAMIGGVANDKLLIQLYDPAAPVGFLTTRQLWVRDGAGTALLKQFAADNTLNLKVIGDRGYFAASESDGIEPWVTDGTPAGTLQLANVNAGDSDPVWFADFHGVTLFAAFNSSAGPQLWRTDGTPAGTRLVAGIPARPIAFANPQAVLRQQLAVGQKFFFVATDPEVGDELYVLVNETPVAGADSGNSANSAAVDISVLANDTDADGTLVPQSMRIATNPAHGTVAINTNGTLVYTPAASFSGTDTFTYTVDDNQGATSNAAIVTLTVTAPPPTVVTTGKRSGGGSMGAAALAALGMLLIFRMRPRVGVIRRASATRS